jgi:hypothetical protein
MHPHLHCALTGIIMDTDPPSCVGRYVLWSSAIGPSCRERWYWLLELLKDADRCIEILGLRWR